MSKFNSMKETAFNSHQPVLKASLRKFHPQPQGSLATGCE